MSGPPPVDDVATVVSGKFCVVTCALDPTCLRYQPMVANRLNIRKHSPPVMPDNITRWATVSQSAIVHVVIGLKSDGRLTP